MHCKEEQMVYRNLHAAELLNRCSDAINHTRHNLALSLLNEFDETYGRKQLAPDIVYIRLKLGSELYFRIGKYKEGIDVIDKNLPAIRNNAKQIISILIYKGKLEMMLNRHKISISSFSEALGLAESAGDSVAIAEVYMEISRMFAISYFGLAMYFIRKAEVFWNRSKENKFSSLAKAERALISYLAYLENRYIPSYLNLKQEASSIANEIDWADGKYNVFERKWLRYIKSYIQGDLEDLRKQIKEEEDTGALPSICNVIESYIAACIEAGDSVAALAQSDKYLKYEIELRGEGIKEHILSLKPMLESGQKIEYLPWRVGKDPDKLPDLLDVLDKISMDEEIWRFNQGRYKGLFPGIEKEGFFEIIQMPNGKASLVPCNPSLNRYYRGQSSYFEECYPSLYRKGMSEAQQFIERVKYEEFKMLVMEYPLTRIFSSGIPISYPDGSCETITLNVDIMALAQHYGIKTELMDVTSDKFVAAFFASTVCGCNGSYRPITNLQQEPGVFYHYVYSPFVYDQEKLRAVGLQPFSRPGEQSGFVVEMSPGENFNTLASEKILFKHDPEVAQFIFNYTNRSAKLFPPSILERKANTIKSSDKFSRAAFDAVCEEFYPDTDKSVCLQYMTDCQAVIVDDPIVWFTDTEKQDCLTEWENHGMKDTMDKIVSRSCFQDEDIKMPRIYA